MLGMIADIEDRILEIAETALTDKVRVYASLPGGWTLDMLERALQTAPGIYTTFAGSTRKQEGVHDGRFTVYTVTKGADESARRRGTPRVIGAYEMVERLAADLDESAVTDIGTLIVNGIDNLFRDAMFDLGGTVYGIQLTLPNMPFEYALDLAGLDDFVTFDARYDLDTAQDDEPVANDHVTNLDQ